ncbi:MAG: primosomal protein N' [Gammaproteobacteria bacterium]
MSESVILRVALPVPLRRLFDYLPGDVEPEYGWVPGLRLQVPFGRKQMTGILAGVAESSDLPRTKLKRIGTVLDEAPIISETDMQLLEWAAAYYHYPPGEVICLFLPSLLRQGRAARKSTVPLWMIAEQAAELPEELQRAPKQLRIARLLQEYPEGLSPDILSAHFSNWHTPMKALLEKGLVKQRRVSAGGPIRKEGPPATMELNPEQREAVERIAAEFGKAARFLLDGITGSGKTEVYVELIKSVIEAGKQALVLVPEIGLTPQFIARLRDRLQAHIVIMHSGLTENQRLQGWLEARDGSAAVILGTRSAVWTPMKNAGLIIVDEEHDPSFKQQESFRYSARDVAIKRASLIKIPIVLGSATPSMESLHNALSGKYRRLVLQQRVGKALPPQMATVDLRNRSMHGALSDVLITAIREQLTNRQQVLLFLNRRGFSPVLMCHHCGWTATCPRCAIPMTYHKQRNSILCHHCGSQAPAASVCGECGMAELVQVGYGTERLTEALGEVFPEARILRIDRDSTRRKGALEQMVEEIHAGEADILVGTQMLAKGHHFPDLTLVGIIDADRGLFSADFRASERMAQQIMQVSGRAGRASRPGTVLIQTHYPDHPLLNTLIRQGYHAFADVLLEERKLTGLPPFSFLALLSAEDYDDKTPVTFLNEARAGLRQAGPDLEIMGPVPAPMEKRAGRFRFQLLIQSATRAYLHNVLRDWCPALENLDSARKVRWSLDVDPQDLL